MNKVKDWYDKIACDMPRVLEIGCETCEKVTIDISNSIIDKQKHYAINAEEMNRYFKYNYFDEIRAFGSLEHINFAKVLENVYKILKPKGVFKFRIQKNSWLIRFYIRYFRKSLEKDNYFKQKKYKINDVKDLLNECGFTIFKIKPLNWGAIYEIWAKKEQNNIEGVEALKELHIDYQI